MAKIKLAKKDTLTSDEFSPKYAKEKISIWVDEASLMHSESLGLKDSV